jgi:hypothetical protein
MVTIHPPGSRPGITSFAMAPTINPNTIHPIIPILASFRGIEELVYPLM